jgi:hypothetical protein
VFTPSGCYDDELPFGQYSARIIADLYLLAVWLELDASEHTRLAPVKKYAMLLKVMRDMDLATFWHRPQGNVHRAMMIDCDAYHRYAASTFLTAARSTASRALPVTSALPAKVFSTTVAVAARSSPPLNTNSASTAASVMLLPSVGYYLLLSFWLAPASASSFR